MKLDNLIQDISQMTHEELRARLTEIRNNRLQAPEKVKAAARKKKATAKTAVEKLMGSMSKEDLAKLMEKYRT